MVLVGRRFCRPFTRSFSRVIPKNNRGADPGLEQGFIPPSIFGRCSQLNVQMALQPLVPVPRGSITLSQTFRRP